MQNKHCQQALKRPFQKERKNRENEAGKGEVGEETGEKKRGERERENPSYPLGGKAAIEKLLNLHLAGLIGNEEAY